MKKNNFYTKKAVALSYQADKDIAPKVVAKGNENRALQIISLAKARNIPIQQNPSLVQLLSQLEVNELIPEELYNVVAEVFAFIYQIDEDFESK